MATIQDLGKVAYFNKGMYNSETNYEINDVVSYNGSSYVSLLNNNQGNLPTNATYWSVVALKGDKGDTGKPFVIEKTYESIEDMVADYDNMQVNDYVMIQGNIEEEENATLWTKTETEVSPYKWVYLADFSGASGITGATPNIQIGTVTEGNEPAVTRRAGSSNENPILDFVLKTGATGQTGATGNGISSVSKTSTSGLTDTYTITYTNGNTTAFNVSNGKGIDRIEKTATVGNIDTYTIYFNDNSTSTFEVANGEVTKEELQEEVDRLSMIYNLFPTTSDEDTEMTLDGTGEVKLKKIDLKGNTYQESTTGKNLLIFPYSTSSRTEKGVTWTVNSDGTITVNGTASGGDSLFNLYYSNTTNLVNDTENQYTFYIGVSSTATNVRRVSGEYINGSMSYYPNSNANIGTVFTTSSDASGQLFRLSVVDGMKADNVTIYPMIVEGNYSVTQTSYEPYTGNQPSPSPDYPQDIQVVTGDNTIKVEGKNLFNASIQEGTFKNTTYTVASDGKITQSSSDDSGWGLLSRQFTLKSGTYTISLTNKPSTSYIQLRNITDGNDLVTTNNDSATFTINDTKIVAFKTYSMSGTYPISYYVQLEKGSSSSAYTPYVSQTYPINLGNIELCKIGDYQDYIYKNNGKWYLNKQIGKVVLDGSEDNWQENAGTRGAFQVTLSNVYYPNNSAKLSISDYFNSSNGTMVFQDDNTISTFSNNRIYIHYSNYQNNLAGFKTWLSTHNITVYYVLETPTITEITDTTLIEQLDNLENAYSYDTQTNITQTNDDMPFILDVEAILSLKGVLN